MMTFRIIRDLHHFNYFPKGNEGCWVVAGVKWLKLCFAARFNVVMG